MSRILNLKVLLLVSILLLQVSLYNPNISLPIGSYGDFSLQTAIEKTAVKKTFATANFAISTEKPESIIFVGDVLLARNVEYLMRKEGTDYPFAGIGFKEFAQKPFVVGNFEASIPNTHKPTPSLGMQFSVDENLISGLKKSGFSHLSLANNHSFDYGREGYENTMKTLSDEGLKTLGHPNLFNSDSVSFLKIGDMSVSVITLHALHSTPSMTEIVSVLNYASKQSEMQILYVHWGIEYDLLSANPQKELARKFIQAGTDLVIGHHPHVVQEVGFIDGVPVFYSLGNFIFDQYFSEAVQTGLMLQLQATPYPALYLLPVESRQLKSQPSLLKSAAHAKFLNNLAKSSDSQIRDNILAGVIPLQLLVATSSKVAIISK